MSRYFHDVHDANVAIAVEVTARIIARSFTLTTPPAGHLHDVYYIHVAVAVQVAE
jgi:hypothetical protein